MDGHRRRRRPSRWPTCSTRRPRSRSAAALREYVEANKVELLTSGIVADRIAAKTQLPLPYVEAELKGYAKEHPGLNSKRLDGRVVLYREGASLSQPPAGAAASGASASGGGSSMPLLETLRALFGRKGENEKKIAFLAERRAALSQQRDRAYEDMSALEQQDAALRQQFKDATGAITKRRITSQLLQLRKDLDRRQQLLAVLNQQINVVSTHLHNLELVQQGQTARLPDAEEMTADAVKAEEMLADLEASNELAGSTGESADAGMTRRGAGAVRRAGARGRRRRARRADDEDQAGHGGAGRPRKLPRLR